MSAKGDGSNGEEKKPSKSLSWQSIVKSLIAGGVAGAVSRTAVAPLERLKILMQVQGKDKLYTGVWQGLKYMAKEEGIRGMFRGNWTNCVRIIPNSAVKFLTYEQLSRRISHQLIEEGGDGQMTPVLRLGAGAVAGIVGMSATYPLDMVRGRLTVQSIQGNHRYRGIMHATSVIIKEEGIIALWKGWLPSVIGVIPYVGLNFAVYETLKDHVLKYYELNDERELSTLTRLACGGLAGTTGQTVAYPLDVVRRRMQMSGWQGAQALHAEGGSAVAYTGMMDCLVRTVKEEGVRALFKGLWPNYIKVVPSIAIAFVTYEKLKEGLGVELRISS
ncbi:g5368 [Coccomyxa viridis]|uniref:G5368 protein n=1 Tax=Coccomyxa viridis TaxID=1274662 RepID=A0ABP1FSN3_9CHLO